MASLVNSSADARQLPPIYNLSSLNLDDGDYLEIPPGATLQVDMSPGTTPNLGGLFVRGKVVFLPTTNVPDVELRSAWIILGTNDSGNPCEIRMGTSTSPIPLERSATLTLVKFVGGTATAADLDDPDNDGSTTPSPAARLQVASPSTFNALAADGGMIVFEYGKFLAFGEGYGESWTKLFSPGAVNDGTITVEASGTALAAWAGGDVVIASTDFDASQAQVVNVSSVSAGSTPAVLDFSGVLSKSHSAMAYKPDSGLGAEWQMDEFAEVGLLTRNVLIRAQVATWDGVSEYQYSDGTGEHGHVILTRDSDGPQPIGRFDWVQFKNLGVEGMMMRYPLHYHLTGDFTAVTNPSMVMNSSFTYCFNKFLAIHDTQNIVVSGNVGYDTIGNGYYLEDFTTTGITLTENLGLGVRAADPENYAVLQDLEPAVFWYESADNLISGNHAAGSSHYGFWYHPGEDNETLGFEADGTDAKFTFNVGHSNGHHGFYQDRIADAEFLARATPWYADDKFQLQNCSFYKNRRYGLWLRSYGRVCLDLIRVADNRSGFYFASDGFQYVIPGPSSDLRTLSRITLSNALAIGETDNIGFEDTSKAWEDQANRSLPQPVINYDGDRQHDLVWGSLTGIDLYDGLIELNTVRFGDFEKITSLAYGGGSSAPRFAAAISQVVYDSQYMADPRNRVEGLAFWNVPYRVAFRYPSAAASGANMIKNTILYDADGSVTDGDGDWGPGFLVPLDEPLLTFGITTGQSYTPEQFLFVDDEDEDFASLVIETAGSGAGTPSVPMVWARMSHSYPNTGGTQKVKQADGQDKYPLTVIMDREYALNYLDGSSTPAVLSQANRPHVVDLNLRFSSSTGKYVLIAVPWYTTKPSIRTVNGAGMTEQVSLTDLRNSGNTDNFFYWDSASSTIYVKIVSALKTGSVDLLATGTEQLCHIAQ